MTAKRIVTFGEILLRLNAPGHERLLQSPTFEATFGGAEANVAVGLAHFGHDSAFVTRLPPNAIGDAALRALRGEGVDARFVQRGGERVGIYFSETGAGPRGSQVIYDRARSATSEITASHVTWPEVLRGAAWFHTTGITPALGAGPAECTEAALVAARAAGATVSFDLNYRSNLWSEADARRVLRPLVRRVDVLIANENHLALLLDAKVARDDDAYRAAAARAVAEYGVGRVAITVRDTVSASETAITALLYDGARGTLHRGPRYALPVIGRIGGGDAFAAGLVHALLEGWSPDRALGFAVAASAIEHTIPGDFGRSSVEEVERLAAGDDSARVRR